MMKYYNLLKYELKNLLRDKMNLMMFVYPLLMLVMAVFLFPFLFQVESAEGAGLEVTMIVVIIALVGFGYIIASALLGFSLLDNKDEDTMQTIAVTPISKVGYVNFKLVYTYILSVLSTLIILSGTKLFASDAYILGAVKLFEGISHFQIFVFSLSTSLLVPALGLLIVGLAKNKVEGFAYMKGSGFLMLIPMLVLLPTFKGAGQYLLAIFPNFWGVQGILNLMFPQLFSSSANLGFYAYMLIGAVVCMIYSIICYKFYMKRAI
jgi:fluoroquinolone transport system permease protein